MNISSIKLKQIIIEEYLKEEGIIDEALSKEKSDQVLAWLRGEGPRPDWLTDDYGTAAAAKRRKNQAVQAPQDSNVDRAAETMPFPVDDASDDTPSSEVHPIKATIDGIYELVSDMEPEDVKDIFQIVFERLPGVELLSPGDEEYPEQKPPTEYVRGAMGRPKVGFDIGLDEIKKLIRKVLTEGGYPGMGDEHSKCIAGSADKRVKDAVAANAKRIIVFDADCNLMNPEEIDATLADLEGGTPLDDLYPSEMY